MQLMAQEALDAYLNREEFRYDGSTDAFYRHYRDQYQDLGKTAMMDTMGQAAALTGGYGSSYGQNVGQQAYQSYLKELNDVVPELYQLAYDRYQDRGDRLYQTYETYAKAAEEATQQEQWEREFAEKQRQFDMEYDLKKSELEANNKVVADNFYGWLGVYQGKGERADPNNPAIIVKYDNGNVTTGNILIMQRVLGLPETGMWTAKDRRAAGKMGADQAWEAYQAGKLQNRHSADVGSTGMTIDTVRMLERVLGREEDGFWSKEDRIAAGGLSLADAWIAYSQGKLQLRR